MRSGRQGFLLGHVTGARSSVIWVTLVIVASSENGLRRERLHRSFSWQRRSLRRGRLSWRPLSHYPHPSKPISPRLAEFAVLLIRRAITDGVGTTNSSSICAPKRRRQTSGGVVVDAVTTPNHRSGDEQQRQSFCTRRQQRRWPKLRRSLLWPPLVRFYG